jgi:hypothetical protein
MSDAALEEAVAEGGVKVQGPLLQESSRPDGGRPGAMTPRESAKWAELHEAGPTLLSALSQLFLTLLTVFTLLLPAACLLPPVVYRLAHWRGPLSQEQYRAAWHLEGKTAEEVRGAPGEPDDRVAADDGSERWYYLADSYGFAYVGVKFGPDGRVRYSWS